VSSTRNSPISTGSFTRSCWRN